MQDLPSPKTSDASIEAKTIKLHFGLVNKAKKEFKILGIFGRVPLYRDPPPPHKIGDRVFLTGGKFPLESHEDVGKFRITFINDAGIEITGILSGFSWQCSVDSGENMSGGHIAITLDN
jgi:hypothetical protein